MVINKKAIRFVKWFLVLLTAAKVFSVAIHKPVLGYGNNWDFIRQSSCIGIYPAYEALPRGSAHPSGPYNNLIFSKETDSGLCMHSIDNLFPQLALSFSEKGDHIGIRRVGTVKSIFVIASIVGLILLCSEYLGLVVALAAYLVLGDLANLLYLNTLYTEFSVILGVYLCVAAISILAAQPKTVSLANTTVFILLGIVLLGFGKQQYSPLAVVFFLFFVLFSLEKLIQFPLRNWISPFLSVVFLITVSIPVLYSTLNSTNAISAAVVMANKTDTFLWAVLPEAHNKPRALEILGLQKSCEPAIGKNWYTEGVQTQHPCPELRELSRMSLVPLFMRMPETFFVPMKKALNQLWPYYPNNVGHVEIPGKETPLYYFLKYTSPSTYIAHFFREWSVALGLISFSGCIMLAFVKRKAQSLARVGPLFIGMGGVISFYSVFSSVFGDGYAEVSKHAVGFLIGLSFQISGIFAGIIVGLRKKAVVVR
jgi:hypothetical protein